MSTLVLCPSRGRPSQAEELLETFVQTRRGNASAILFVVDADDPTADDYPDAATVILDPPPGNMATALNTSAMHPAIGMSGDWDILSSVGDDHRFLTPGWDVAIEEVLRTRGGGFAYGDDMGQGSRLPTGVFISASIIRALGWMALPGCRHLYIDNAWKALGEVSGRLFYLPNVKIEHRHPTFGKAEWDEGYKRVNSSVTYAHDQEVFRAWVADGLERDARTVRAAVGEAA